MTDRALTFVLSNRVQVRTAAPYLAAWSRDRGRAFVVGPENALEEVRRSGLDPERVRSVPVGSLPKVWRLVARLHRAWMLGRGDREMSRYFEGMVDAHAGARSLKGAAVRLLRGAREGRLSSAEFNRTAARAIGSRLRNPLPTQLVVAVSRTSQPHLLCGGGARVATLIESWDHPFAHPAGYVSEWIVPWNQDLGRDWLALQDPEAAQVLGYPIKLCYALAQRSLPEPAEPALTYAAGTSSHSRHAAHFREERALIRALSRGAAAAGWKLLVKPHPMTRPGDFHDMGVEILGYRGAGVNDYSLDDAYDRDRLEELRRTTWLANGWTTFGLDAAAAGRPVLQFRLSPAGWPHLADLYRGEHIRRYYLGDGETVLELGSEEEIPGQVERAIGTWRARAEEQSRRMRRWLTPEPAPAAAVERVVHALGTWTRSGCTPCD